jgi:2-oxoglutarate dehydrogenase E2 component (dihydrolipoamide succinyltransferase)
LVPVVPQCRENLTFRGIEADALKDWRKARDGQITVDDMTGGTFYYHKRSVFWKYVVYACINPPFREFWNTTHHQAERPITVNG